MKLEAAMLVSDVVGTHESKFSVALAYEDRLKQETERFANELEVNNLPAIFHYWSNRYLLPQLQAFGFQHPEHFFETEFASVIRANPGQLCRFASLGSGNGDAEVRIAQGLLAQGLSAFCIDCLELTPEMNARTTELAQQSGVAAQVRALSVDLNSWTPQHTYSAIMANQSLHHMVELERILDTVKPALAPEARFLISDMIGRNGHQRWPEALAIVREFWNELPDSYRHNLQLNRAEPEFLDWDCSAEGFEGIRSQDILALLCERFQFELFLPFANIIDPFIDRSFGHHFVADGLWDRDFIDRVHARDELELAKGNIKPTHLIAVLTKTAPTQRRWRAGFSPEASIRR
ncbi:MAG: class I SAM-dependent methyltransferase [Pseudomonadota bacterium]|nr:class I SAM-dependent methyltransferase [Pseudomonadota bacterium]